VIARRDPEGAWVDVARSDAFDLACLAPTSHGVFAGTEEAHLLRLVGDDGALAPVEAFGTVEGRETWFTPWGGPPAVRSIAQDLAGRLHANVHVGGIPARSTRGRAGSRPSTSTRTSTRSSRTRPNPTSCSPRAPSGSP
jgi:hypothetical protein